MASKTYCPRHVYCFNIRSQGLGCYYIVWTHDKINWVAKVPLNGSLDNWIMRTSDSDMSLYKDIRFYNKYNGPRKIKIEREYILSVK